jgi:hypothetical protein
LDAIVQVLRDDSTRVVVLASEEPFLLAEGDEPPQSTRMMSARTVETSDLLTWRSRPEELIYLLDLLFAWKSARYPAREAILISGGVFGTSGDVWDNRLGLSIPIVVTGPVLGRVKPLGRWRLNGTLGGGRFSYSHRHPSERWNATVLDIYCGPPGSGARPSVDIELVEVPIPPGVYDPPI